MDAQEKLIQQGANFYIIRRLWVRIHGKRWGGLTVHKAFGMSRPRYERFIHGGNTRMSQEELTRWKAMGVPKAVMTGDKLIAISMLRYADWENFFLLWEAYRDQKDTKDENVSQRYLEEKKAVDLRIDEADLEDGSNLEFRSVVKFIREANAQASSADVKLMTYINHIANVTPDELAEINLSVLEQYVNVLKAQLTLAEAVNTLRNYGRK